MLLRSGTIGLFLATFLLSAFPAFADISDPCGCNAGIAPELTTYASNSQERLSFMKQVNQEQYEKMKKEGSISATFPDLPVGGSASYSEFNESRNKYLEQVNFSMSTDRAQSYLFSTVRTDSWAACKKACIARQTGFYCDVADLTRTIVTASCSWRPEGTSQARVVQVTINSQSRAPQQIDANTTRDWQFDRNPNADIVMTFTPEGGSSQTLKVPAVPKPQPVAPKPNMAWGSCIGRGGVEGVHFWGPVGETCNGIPAWGKYSVSSSAQPTEICSCTGHGGVEGVRMWGAKGEACGGIPSWGTYNQQCVSIAAAACGCTGRGDILSGQVLWGPKDKACGGMDSAPEWGKYAQFCKP